MEHTKKIITRAVYGHRIQTFKNIVCFAADEAEKLSDVLGCTINGAKILGSYIESDDAKGKKVRANVKFDIHIWYRVGNDTKVSKVGTEFSDIIEVAKQGAESFGNEEVTVWIKEKPKCVDTTGIGKTKGSLFAVQLEYVLEAEIIGETTLNVKIYETE